MRDRDEALICYNRSIKPTFNRQLVPVVSYSNNETPPAVSITDIRSTVEYSITQFAQTTPPFFRGSRVNNSLGRVLARTC